MRLQAQIGIECIVVPCQEEESVHEVLNLKAQSLYTMSGLPSSIGKSTPAASLLGARRRRIPRSKQTKSIGKINL